MSSARELPARDYQRLKLATGDAIESCGGSRRAEKLTRVSHQQLGSYRSEAEADAKTFIAVDVAADLEADLVSRGQRPLITEALADIAGFVLYPKPETLAADSDDFALVTMAKETAEVLAEALAAKADGRVSPAERQRVRQQAREAIVALIMFEQRWENDADE